MNEPLPTPRKRPKQQRSRLLFSSIKEACQKIIETEGEDKLTIARIAEVCGIAVGSFYQYFPNVEAVLSEIYLDQMPTPGEIVLDLSRLAKRSSSLEGAIRGIIEYGLFFHGRRLSFNKAYYQKYHQHYHPLNRYKSHKVYSKCVQIYCDLLEHYQHSRGIENIELKGFLLMEILGTSMHEMMDQYPDLWNSEAFSQVLFSTCMGLIDPKH